MLSRYIIALRKYAGREVGDSLSWRHFLYPAVVEGIASDNPFLSKRSGTRRAQSAPRFLPIRIFQIIGSYHCRARGGSPILRLLA